MSLHTGLLDLSVLRHTHMIDTVNKIVTDRDNYFSGTVFAKRTPLLNTDIAEWDEYTAPRTRAKFNARGNAAMPMDLLSVTRRTASVADIFVSKTLTGAQIEYLRNVGTEHDEGATRMINAELADMRRAIDYTVEWACVNAALGTLTINQSATAKMPASVAANVTITFGVTTLSRLTAWNVNTTKILSTELTAVDQKGLETWGGVPDLAIHNASVMNYLVQNDEVQNFMTDARKDAVFSSGTTAALRGKNWRSYDRGDKDSGSFAKYFPDDKVLFVGGTEYMEILEASALIPSPDRQSLIRTAPGYYAYADVEVNPPSVTLYMGYRFLPVNRYPEKTILFTAV